MIWKKKKDAAAQSAEAAGEMTGAKGRTGAGAFAKKELEMARAAGRRGGSGRCLSHRRRQEWRCQPRCDLRRDDAGPSGCLQLPERHRHAEPGQYIYRQVSGGRQDPHRRL